VKRSGLLVIAGLLAVPFAANADVQHTVGRGHTIEAIANRYHVTTKQIIDANHLTDVKHLHPGDVLTIPTKDSPASSSKSKTAKADHDKKGKTGQTGHETTTYAMKPKTPGVLKIHRVATNEDFTVKVSDGKKGRVSPTTLKTFEKMMRSPSGAAHPIEPRLVALLTVVSNHFGGRQIEVISGFRPYTPTQYNPHSNHMHGKAIDFRVAGVPNEVVRDFCRTLKNTGCGYYPNSVFVHMDARDQSAFWIDYSKPGEAPRYNAPDANADEGTSDVHNDGSSPATTTPSADSPASNTAPSETPSEKPAEKPAETTTKPTTPEETKPAQ
jgi:uncharacterized protein YcbK (DUF882 family)